jgi:tRNA threonylcarbamoyladenosine biosynthesis protein TsaB
MKLLALDTSSLACTVALRLGDELLERHEEQAREHTRLLMPMIREVLQESGAELPDLDAIVLGNGPGSFIGMRIAASVAQGLAHGAGLKIVPVSSLAAVAAEAFSEARAEEVVVAQDAHMNEVYLGKFSRGVAGVPVAMSAEVLHGHEIINDLAVSGAAARIAAGQGWQRYPKLMAINKQHFYGESDVLYPRGRFLLTLGAAALEQGNFLLPQDIAPAYLRNKVAEKPAA